MQERKQTYYHWLWLCNIVSGALILRRKYDNNRQFQLRNGVSLYPGVPIVLRIVVSADNEPTARLLAESEIRHFLRKE